MGFSHSSAICKVLGGLGLSVVKLSGIIPLTMTTTTAHTHLLQSSTWGALKNHFGWTPWQTQIDNITVQILFRHIPNRKLSLYGKPLGFTIAYIPKGPILEWQNQEQCQSFFSAIHTEAKKRRAIFLKVEPNLSSIEGQTDNALIKSATNFLTQSNFILATAIQPQTSIIINISPDEDAILAAMKQKTRYNIRLARKKGVTIRFGTAADIPTFYNLAQLTAERDKFDIHSLPYYQSAYQLFAPKQCALLIAEYQNQPLASLMTFCHHQMAYYFYGASSNIHRNLMPTYLLQWEAIHWAKQQGCTHYDLWGIPDADFDTLEAEFRQRHEGLWGVYRFKRGFGGQIIKNMGAYDYIYKPILYKLYLLKKQGMG